MVIQYYPKRYTNPNIVGVAVIDSLICDTKEIQISSGKRKDCSTRRYFQEVRIYVTFVENTIKFEPQFWLPVQRFNLPAYYSIRVCSSEAKLEFKPPAPLPALSNLVVYTASLQLSSSCGAVSKPLVGAVTIGNNFTNCAQSLLCA